VRRSEVDERVVREALNSLLLGDARPPGPSLELSKLVDKLDAEYFRLGKASPGSTALRRFSQARAVQSLIYAWLSPDLEPTADAVYEAAMSLDDPSPLLKAVWATIE
jgi:hypothetical protein